MTRQALSIDPEANWITVDHNLDTHGFADIGPVLTDGEIDDLKALYPDDRHFRSHIVMRRHGFGEGEYKYFANPLPAPVARLRERIYPQLVATANRWAEMMNTDHRYPPVHAEFRAACHALGQARPTPLMLKYGPGDFNCLHQDLYGDLHFPLQMVVLLSEPGADFTGGEFVVTEQRPRMQSRAEVVPLRRGHGLVFSVQDRPKQGTRGHYRVKFRHGVSRLHTGERYALGIIFHDAT